MIKNIIFDWSGVIKDAAKLQLVIVNKIFNVFNHDPISLEELKDKWKQPYMLFYNSYLPSLTSEEQSALFQKFIFEEPMGEPIPGIVDLVKQLRDLGKTLIVVSSDLPDTLLPEIKEYGLTDVFNEVITDVEEKEASVKEIILKNNFQLDETIFIGDSNHEIEVGKKVGIKTCAVTWGFTNEERLRETHPDFLARNVKELEEILK